MAKVYEDAAGWRLVFTDHRKIRRTLRLARLPKKELEKIGTEITKAEQKLSNPNFASKAPPQVLQEHQQRLTEWQAKRERLQKALESLQG